MSRRLARLFAMMTLAWSGFSFAQDSATVRLGFLLNFARYVEWPEGVLNADASLRFCLAQGDSEMSRTFGKLLTQTVRSRSIQIRQLTRVETDDCHVIYLPADLLPADGFRWQEAAVQSHTLTVSDAPDFIENGGMIGLVDVGGRYRFDVNLRNVRRAELKISSYLLKLGRTVK